MADHSDIGWTGATWNVITGCKIKSPACRLCYAMDLAGTRLKNHPSRIGLTKIVNGMHVWTGEVRFNEGWLRQPLQWKRPREIFVVAHGDLFYEEVPDAWIDKIFAVMNCATHHTFQTLTKRSQRMRAYMTDPQTPERVAAVRREMGLGGGPLRQWPPQNVHGGVSAERQREADERVPDLLASPFAKRYVSAEPLLGKINFNKDFLLDGEVGAFPEAKGRRRIHALTGECHRYNVVGAGGAHNRKSYSHGWNRYTPGDAKIDQIITGGESGRGKRRPVPTHVDWFRDIRDQCASTDTAYFHKQNGSWLHESQVDYLTDELSAPSDRHEWPDGSTSYLVGTGAAGALLDGAAHEGRPA